eukprot:6185205-Pleurochrysis_carterae.AAC.1
MATAPNSRRGQTVERTDGGRTRTHSCTSRVRNSMRAPTRLAGSPRRRAHTDGKARTATCVHVTDAGAPAARASARRARRRAHAPPARAHACDGGTHARRTNGHRLHGQAHASVQTRTDAHARAGRTYARAVTHKPIWRMEVWMETTERYTRATIRLQAPFVINRTDAL